MESKDKRTGWLAELKEGDEVFVSSKIRGAALSTVHRITPTGRINAGSQVFDARGRSLNGDCYSRDLLKRATPDGIMRYKAQKAHRTYRRGLARV